MLALGMPREGNLKIEVFNENAAATLKLKTTPQPALISRVL